MNIWSPSHVIGEGDGENHLPIFGAFVIEDTNTGETTWGHDTGVIETNIRDFAGNWTGTGSITGAGDTEKLCVNAGEYMISEVVNTGLKTVEIDQNYYDDTGDNIKLSYRHGATENDCQAAVWIDYSTPLTPFASLGYVQVMIESLL
jgi:hypothetical protein